MCQTITHLFSSLYGLTQYGVGVPKGEVARTADEAEAIANKIGMESLHIVRTMDSRVLTSEDRWR